MPQTSDGSGRVLDEFSRFLRASSKNTERFSERLLREISVPTPLDTVLLSAVQEGRDIVIAGTAGSGKTHLLSLLGTQQGLEVLVPFEQKAPRGKRFVRVVEDLTALELKERQRVFERPSNCGSVVVCANEGALILTAAAGQRTTPSRPNRTAVFGEAVEGLHSIQRGETPPQGGPVVLDAAGFDPASGGALRQILEGPLLSELVEESSPCSCDPLDCPRRRAWRLLSDSTVRSRLSSLVEATSVEAEGFTFRTLWNFVADLALGGDCGGGGAVPTAAWFWRTFMGASEVSRRIRDLWPLSGFPLPGAESRLWNGDWTWFDQQARLIDGLPPLLIPPSKPCDLDDQDGVVMHEWLKAQVLFLLRDDVLGGARQMAASSSLWGAVLEKQHHTLIKAINRYMTYGLGHAGSSLELWLDYGMERRTDRPDGQVSIGRPPATEFQIIRSAACANPPSAVARLPQGSRFFLRHRPSGATLALTREMVSVISSGRSFRTSDRVATEIDWLLMSFFSETGAKAATPDHLSLALFRFRTREMDAVQWDVVASPPSVTLAVSG